MNWTIGKDHLLRTFAGRNYPYKEIADKMGITVKDVSTRLYDLRKRADQGPPKTFNELWYACAVKNGYSTAGIFN